MPLILFFVFCKDVDSNTQWRMSQTPFCNVCLPTLQSCEEALPPLLQSGATFYLYVTMLFLSKG